MRRKSDQDRGTASLSWLVDIRPIGLQSSSDSLSPDDRDPAASARHSISNAAENARAPPRVPLTMRLHPSHIHVKTMYYVRACVSRGVDKGGLRVWWVAELCGQNHILTVTKASPLDRCEAESEYELLCNRIQAGSNSSDYIEVFIFHDTTLGPC